MEEGCENVPIMLANNTPEQPPQREHSSHLQPCDETPMKPRAAMTPGKSGSKEAKSPAASASVDL